MKIKQDLIPKDKYSIKSPYKMTPKGICIHNTANDASAKNEIAYMKRNDRQVSFHIAVDDKEAIQAIPFNRNSWHAGDGGNGEGNRNYIAIEICYSKSGGYKFAKAEKNTAELVADLLNKYNWGIDKVKKHKDFSGKYCPHKTLDLGWERFLDMVRSNMNKSYFSKGDKGTGVKILQEDLSELGFNLKVDGSFGPATEKIVKQFQKKYNLKVDGFAGPETLKKIEELTNFDDDILYKVQVGAFANRNNAEKLKKELESKGYKPFIKIEEK